MTGAERIRATFAAATSADRAAFIAYVLAGYPSDEGALAGAEAALAAGADVLEVGVPFSDPMADGPTIAEAGRSALASGAGLASALSLVAGLRRRGHEAPILVMTYLNPLLAAGIGSTFARLRSAGADGVIVPDLPAGFDRRAERAAAACGLATAFLVAPNTPPDRVEAAVRASTAFVYVVPLLGVTGARDRIAGGAVELLRRIRAQADGRVPVAAGFGLKSRAQVAELAPVADGLIVGSALVGALGDGGPEALGALVRELAAGTARPAVRA